MTDILAGSDERVVAKAALEAAEERLRSLCASQAGTFVSVERRGAALESALKQLLANAKQVESQVSIAQQALEQEEEASESSLAALSEKHRVRRRTLLQHSSLLELLELPSLMDACVRSNLYDESLNIAAFANTLERRHTEKNEVVLKVIAQIRSRQGDLRRHLLRSLKNQVTMPECLEIVTALRRLNSIDLERQSASNIERVHAAMELSLQVDFLEARDAWLDQPSQSSSSASGPAFLGASAPKTTSSERLLDTIERYRTRMFEIATQFNAIFRAQASDDKMSVSLLSMWTTRRVHSFLTMLKVEIGTMEDSAALRDALDACVFFSVSMGRLGADFTAQLPPLFEDKMVAIVVHFWKDGITQLAETLKICREAGVAGPLSSTSVDEAVTSESGAASEGDGGPMPPPRQLMALPPLGRLVNAVLAGLNELRRCLLPGIFAQLRRELTEQISQVEEVLKANERAVMTPGLKGEASDLRSKAKELRQVFSDIVVPYIQGSLEISLGNEVGAKVYHDKVIQVLTPPEPEKPVEVEPEAAPTPAADEGGDSEPQQDTPEGEGWDDGLGALEDPEPTTDSPEES
eukprot:Nitzschia sp. Nitz4//scaffold2_size372955//24414//26228//NITZ4_000357-RA/size372955-snap-gene-0.59-mRNA-1//-1//CDS//3329546578//6706//frame0